MQRAVEENTLPKPLSTFQQCIKLIDNNKTLFSKQKISGSDDNENVIVDNKTLRLLVLSC